MCRGTVEANAHRAAAGARRLSPRQHEILGRLLLGEGEKQIACKLGCSRNTVHVHIKVLYHHFGVSTRSELLSRFIPALDSALLRVLVEEGQVHLRRVTPQVLIKVFATNSSPGRIRDRLSVLKMVAAALQDATSKAAVHKPNRSRGRRTLRGGKPVAKKLKRVRANLSERLRTLRALKAECAEAALQLARLDQQIAELKERETG